MRWAKSLMLWCLQIMQEYWWYVEAFCKRPERKELEQIAGENRSIGVQETDLGLNRHPPVTELNPL